MTTSNTHIHCLPLDGALVRGNLLWERLLRLILRKPLSLVTVVSRFIHGGKHGLELYLLQCSPLEVETLPYRRQWLEPAATTTPLTLVAREEEKVLAEAIVERWPGMFQGTLLYRGDMRQSLDQQLGASQYRLLNQHDVTPTDPGLFTTWRRALRLHQWAKNTLLFVPMLLAHTLGDLGKLVDIGLAYIAFGCSASAIYLLNDLVDLDDDRSHPTKHRRPLAAGTFAIPLALLLIPLLLVVSALLALEVNLAFFYILLAYLFLTTAYSFWIKPIVLLDVLTLTSLYTIRIIAGGLAVSVPLSYWLLAFSMFMFLSLALSKRYSELHNVQKAGKKGARGYTVEDLYTVSLFGINAGYLAVMVSVLYIHDLQADKLYDSPDWLWLISVTLLYWVSRIWLLTKRGEMHEDPVIFALRDRPSYVIAALILISLYLAT